MKLIKSFLAPVLIVYLFSGASIAQNLLTVAEQSNYTKTSLYTDVISFIHSLQDNHQNIRLEYFGKTSEGRLMPLVIMGDPLPSGPSEVLRSGRIPVLIQANIHAGEVEGKEASLMIMRDILNGKLQQLLKNQVILFVPIFNADGNEKIDKNNRRGQDGPSEGMGIRFNGQNLDLNRDFIKTESPETQSLISNILNVWDPYLVVDCHTTNGSYHIEPVTFAPPHNPDGDLRIIDYTYFKLLKYAQDKMKSEDGVLSIPYGNFYPYGSKKPEGWYSFDHRSRFATNYFGLRNRLSVLDENYAHATFKERVHGCYSLLKWLLTYTSENADDIAQLMKTVDSDAVQAGLNPEKQPPFGIDFKITQMGDPISIIAYEMEEYTDQRGRKRFRPTDKTKKLTLPYMGKYNITKSITLPRGYLFPGSCKEIADKLMLHGVVVERLVNKIETEVELFKITKIETAKRMFQGHMTVTLQGEYSVKKSTFPAGTYYVPMGQKLNRLAAYLLEPESPDGLVTWNMFDRYLQAQWSGAFNTFPVSRLMNKVNFATETIR